MSVINTDRSHSKFLQSCLRELEFVAAKHEFEIRANPIRGMDNRILDALSRWHMGSQYREAFWSQVAGLKVREAFVYEGLFRFMHDW